MATKYLDYNGLQYLWMKVKAYIDNHSGGGGISIDDVYPVGSIYMSVNAVDPGTLFGGTWVQIQDTFLLAAGTAYSNGATGGNADAIVPYHRHSIAQQTTGAGTSHSHTISHAHATGSNTYTNFVTVSGDLSNDTASMLSGSGYKYPYVSSSLAFSQKTKTGGTDTANSGSESAHTHTLAAHNTNYEGTSGNATGANMPPYLVVNIWKRTA